MIFLTVGSQTPFDRLVGFVERWAGDNPGVEVIAQIGNSALCPHHMRYYSSLPPAEYRNCFSRAEVVVAHAGTGVTLLAAELGVPLVMLPRLPQLREVRNRHQLDYIENLHDLQGIYPANDEASLRALLDGRASLQRMCRFNTAGAALLAGIREHIFA